MKKLAETLHHLSINLETIFSLAGSWSQLPEGLRELIEDAWEDEILIEAGIPEDRLNDLRDGQDWEAFADLLAEKSLTGFLVMASTPVPSGVELTDGKPTSGMYSWGHCQTKWFHVLNLEDELCALLPEWRNGVWLRSHAEENHPAI